MSVHGGSQAVVAPLFLELLAAAEVLGRRHASRADNPQQLVEVPAVKERKSNHVCKAGTMTTMMNRTCESYNSLMHLFSLVSRVGTISGRSRM